MLLCYALHLIQTYVKLKKFATVIFNATFSRIILGEHLPWRGWIGVWLGIAGCVLSALYAPGVTFDACSTNPDAFVYDSLISWRSLIYWTILVLSCCYIANPLGFPWPYGIGKDTALSSAVYFCSLCSLLGTIQVSSSKGVALAITRGLAGHTSMLSSPALCWLTYLLIVTNLGSIALQQKYMNLMLMHLDTSVVVPIHFILWSVITISAGMSLFDETAFQPDIGIPLFVAGVALSSLAVYLLNTSQPPSPEAVVTQPAADEPRAAPTHDGPKKHALGEAFVTMELCFADRLPPSCDASQQPAPPTARGVATGLSNLSLERSAPDLAAAGPRGPPLIPRGYYPGRISRGPSLTWPQEQAAQARPGSQSWA